MLKAQFTDLFTYDRDLQEGYLVQVLVKSRDPRIKGIWGGVVSKINKKSIQVHCRCVFEDVSFLVRIEKSAEVLPFKMYLEEDNERYDSWRN